MQKGQIHLVVLAKNMSARTEEKVGRLARAKGVLIIEGPDSGELGRRFGGKSLQALGLRDASLAFAIGEAERVESR